LILQAGEKRGQTEGGRRKLGILRALDSWELVDIGVDVAFAFAVAVDTRSRSLRSGVELGLRGGAADTRDRKGRKKR